MARQLSGKNGVQISGGGGAGGDSITFVSVPDIQGSSRVAIGRQNEFRLSALCLLANARVLWFTVEATGGVIGGTFPATFAEYGNNIANVRITVPAGTQVGAAIHITVTARDNYGNESLPAKITVTAVEGYVTAPVLSAPLPSSEVAPTSFYAITSAFSVLGDVDQQIASQYVVITDDENSEVLYDSGELTDPLDFVRHVITLPTIPSSRVLIIVKARHRGEQNGWSDYSIPVHCTVSPDRLIVIAQESHVFTEDFDNVTGFSSDGYTLPSKTVIYNFYKHKGTYVALTKDATFWQIYTTTDLKKWAGPFTVDIITNMGTPSFSEFNGHLFLSDRTIRRSSDIGKTWTKIAGTALSSGNDYYGVVCSDDKYCYYAHGRWDGKSGKTTLFKSDDGLIFTSKIIAELATTDLNIAKKNMCYGMCAALGDGLVIFGSQNGLTLHVSNDYGENFSEVDTESGTFGVHNYNEREFIRFGEKIYSIYTTNFTEGSADGKSWGTPKNLFFGKLQGHSLDAGKLIVCGELSGFKESTDATRWASVGTRLQLTIIASYKYFKSRTGDHIIYHANYFHSPDLTTWKSLEGVEVGLPNNINWTDGCYAFGKYFKVGGVGGTGCFSTSLDGVTWTPPITNHIRPWIKIMLANGMLVMSDESRYICFSEDGETWSEKKDMNLIVSGNGKFGYSNDGYFYWFSGTVAASRYTSNLDGPWAALKFPANISEWYINGAVSGGERCFVFVHTSNPWYYVSLVYAGSFSAPVDSQGGSNNKGAYGNNVCVVPSNNKLNVFSNTPSVIGSATFPGQYIMAIKFLHGAFYVCLSNGTIQKSISGISWSAPVKCIREYTTNIQTVVMSNA